MALSPPDITIIQRDKAHLVACPTKQLKWKSLERLQVGNLLPWDSVASAEGTCLRGRGQPPRRSTECCWQNLQQQLGTDLGRAWGARDLQFLLPLYRSRLPPPAFPPAIPYTSAYWTWISHANLKQNWGKILGNLMWLKQKGKNKKDWKKNLFLEKKLTALVRNT